MLLQFTDVIKSAVSLTIPEIVGKQTRVVNTSAGNITVTFGANTQIVGAGLYGDFWYDGADWYYTTPAGISTTYYAQGWLPDGNTWTYVSASSFRITGDHTARLSKGDKIKFTQSGSVKYGIIQSVTYGAPNTTITIMVNTDYVVANAGITAPYFSKMDTPTGFPEFFNYTPTITPETGSGMTATITTARYTVANRLLILDYNILISVKGTGAGALVITTPGTADVAQGGVHGREIVSGYSLSGRIVAGEALLRVSRYDTTTPITATHRHLIRAQLSFT